MELPPEIARDMPFARKRVTVDGVALSVVDEGPRGAPTLLLLHGNPTWSYLYRHLIRPAREVGFRVVVPDHAGCGASDKPEDPQYYSLRRHADNLIAVARELDVRQATVVLHDWGGPTGLGFAVAEPDRVDRLVIANTVAFPPREPRPLTPFHRFFGSSAGYRAGLAFDLVRRTAMRFGVRKRLSPAARRAYAWPMKERGGRIAAGRFVQLVPSSPTHPTAVELGRIWGDAAKLAGKPTVVLWADRDPVFPPKFAERWRRCDLDIREVKHVSPTAGHFWQEDDPQPFLEEILRFAGSD